MKPVVAFDSKEFNRGPPTNRFFCPFGAAVIIKDSEVFKSAYTQIFAEILKKYNLSDKRYIYDSYSISKGRRMGDAFKIISEIVDRAIDYIEGLNVYYTVLNAKRTRTVKVGGVDQSNVKEISPMDFLANLNPTYVHCCAADFRNGPNPGTIPLKMDYFEGKVTKSWGDLTTSGNFEIFHRGDECNPYVNLADLIAWYSDKKLYYKKLRLSTENIEAIWEESNLTVKGVFLGDKYLDKLAWISDNLIDTNPYISKPTIFIVKNTPKIIHEAQRPISKRDKKTFKNAFRSSPLMNGVINKAYEIGGGIKFFDPVLDTASVADNDILVYIGEEAKELAETYADLWEIEIISGKKILDKYKTPRLETF